MRMPLQVKVGVNELRKDADLQHQEVSPDLSLVTKGEDVRQFYYYTLLEEVRCRYNTAQNLGP
jgi:hypothetical protein